MTRRLQRGLGTLAMCVVLLGVLALGAAWATRQLTTAQRVAANDHRAATAFEAAEAGMAWAIAMLNGGHVDDSCRPASHPAGPSADIAAAGTSSASATDFRSRFLELGADGHYRAKPSAPATGGAMSPACTNTGPLRWTCQCATQRDPAGASPTADARPLDPQPRFTVRFTDAGPAGQLKLIVRGCSDRRADCDDLSEGPSGLAEAARHLALLSALRLPPPQAATEGPGSFLRVFGYPAMRYRGQPAIARMRCDADCGAPLAQALARGRRLIWIDGDARLSEWPPAALDGTPLVLVVDGRLDLSAPGSAQGVLYAREGIGWHPPVGQAASWRGAIVTDGVFDPGKTVTLTHDAAVLYRVHRQMGSFLPVPGGWSPTR